MQAERDMQSDRARGMPVSGGKLDYLDERMQARKWIPRGRARRVVLRGVRKLESFEDIKS